MLDIHKPARALSAFAYEASGAVFEAMFRARAFRPGVLIALYFRLKLRRFWQENLLSGKLSEETLFGASLSLRDHAVFSRMAREIFLRQVYYFRADKPDPRILDCGGNIGLATLFFKRLYPGARVTVFEPDPENFRLLEANLETAGLGDVERVRAALAGTRGELEFRRSPWDAEGVNARLSNGDGRREREEGRDIGGAGFLVRAEILSAWIDGEIDFLKLDIEGAEAEVLRELAAAGKLALVANLTVEYHHHHTRGADQLAGFLALLEANGFGYRLLAGEGADEAGSPQDVLIQAYRKRP
jgi:FkbM family methyltransferase